MKDLPQLDLTRAYTDSTSLSLLEKIRAREESAWQRLVDLYGPLVFSWCCRCGLSREDASDVFQEVLAAVAANIAQFRRQRPGDTFRGWLRVIARNQSRLHFRRQRDRPRAIGGSTAQMRVQELPDEMEQESDPSTETRERSGLLRRGLDLVRSEFEEHTWRAFWLVVVEQCSPREVGAQLQMTSGAVRQAKYKVLRKLRNELGELLE